MGGDLDTAMDKVRYPQTLPLFSGSDSYLVCTSGNTVGKKSNFKHFPKLFDYTNHIFHHRTLINSTWISNNPCNQVW